MQIQILESPDNGPDNQVAIVRLGDSVNDAFGWSHIRKDLLRLAGQHRRMILNFANVRQLSSAGLGGLIILHKRLMASAGALRLCEVRPEVQEVLGGIPRGIIPVFDSEQEALEGWM